MEIRTARLRLRPLIPEDADRVAALDGDPRVMEMLAGVRTRARVDEWMTARLAHWQAHDYGPFIVEAAGGFVGIVGLSRTDFDAGLLPGVEIAWRLAFESWGRGYATEAARATLRDGFERVGLAEIVAATAETNARSRAVMTRLGMTESPSEAFDHPRVAAGSPLRRHVVYRLRRA